MLTKAEVAAVRERARREKNDHGVLLVPAGEFHAALDTIEAFAEALEQEYTAHHSRAKTGLLHTKETQHPLLDTYHAAPTEGDGDADQV